MLIMVFAKKSHFVSRKIVRIRIKKSQEPKLPGFNVLFRNQAISFTVMETSGRASMELLTTISPDLIMSFTAV